MPRECFPENCYSLVRDNDESRIERPMEDSTFRVNWRRDKQHLDFHGNKGRRKVVQPLKANWLTARTVRKKGGVRECRKWMMGYVKVVVLFWISIP